MGHIMGPNQYYLRHLCLVEVGNVKEKYLILNCHQSLQTTCKSTLLKMLISQRCSRIGTRCFIKNATSSICMFRLNNLGNIAMLHSLCCLPMLKQLHASMKYLPMSPSQSFLQFHRGHFLSFSIQCCIAYPNFTSLLWSAENLSKFQHV